MDKIKARFLNKVEIGNYCWIWKGAIDEKGYGRFSYLGKNNKAHRISWMIMWGSIPKGILICHHCDNPKCVNPDHLFLGTYKDNTNDMCQKGRHWNKMKIKCKWGHRLSGNSYIHKNGWRFCRKCTLARSAKTYYSKHAKEGI